MKTYYVEYIMGMASEVEWIRIAAKNKAEAYDKATYEDIPRIEGSAPYASWVASVTYGNGNHKTFNTFAGKPY